MTFQLTSSQSETLAQPFDHSIFLHGPAGCGKTTVGVQRVLQWINAGIPAEEILVLVPQRSLAIPYYEALRSPELPPGGVTDILTLGGLGQRMISLFWPIVAEEAGFQNPDQAPSFLTLETAQYIMNRIVQPFIDEDFFLSVSLDPNRLLSQIIDNLNKAASIGINHQHVGELLSAAWIGDQADQVRIYETAQRCANQFREYCYQENLLDFSLQLELFTRHLWQTSYCHEYLQRQYRYLVYDNLEEDVPVVHDVMLEWLPDFEGALCISDDHAGYRLFLGADARSSYRLKDACQTILSFSHSFVTSPILEEFASVLDASIHQPQKETLSEELHQAFNIEPTRFHPEMIQKVTKKICQLIENNGAQPDEIVVLSPFLSDSLRFALNRELSQAGLVSYTTRPSRSLGDEPVTQCLLALAKLANPIWGPPPSEMAFSYALMQSIGGLDLVRASLMRRVLYRPNKIPADRLSSFTDIKSEMQERISYQIGQNYESLRDWLLEVLESSEKPELDVFLSRLFGEVLSQAGFAFHHDIEAAALTSRLIESVQKFRRGTNFLLKEDENRMGAEYIAMLERGVIAAQYLQNWEPQPTGTILLAPAYTFLMSNRPARFQFWLDIGSAGWWQRVYQPLTHPVVLSRNWEIGQKWTDLNEQAFNVESLSRLTQGLLARCKEQVFLYILQIDQQGYESHGLLLTALQNILRRLPLLVETQENEVDHV